VLKHLVSPEPFLKENYYVYFTKSWSKEYADKFFRVDSSVQIPYKINRIVAPGDTFSLDFSENGLMPEYVNTLYEIYCGFRGYFLLMPKIPGNTPTLKLEASGFTPNLEDDNMRYLGTYMPEDTPFDSPKLRIHTVRYMQSVVFDFYCDSIEPEKLRVNFLINRCKIVEVKKEEVKAPFRKIVYYKDWEW
jgi:hypothetical protein